MNVDLKVNSPVYPVNNWDKLSEEDKFNLRFQRRMRELSLQRRTLTSKQK